MLLPGQNSQFSYPLLRIVMTMKTPYKRFFVIGISAVSGGGKTAVARKLADLLPDSVILCFDDYDDTTIHPEDLQEWFKEGADYNAWKTPILTSDLESLTTGNHITSPVDGSVISPAKYIVFDAPLGRAHFDTGRFIDFMVFIDTPLDIAMARRLLRDMAIQSEQDVKDTITTIKTGLASYLNGARPLYIEFEERIKRECDMVLDGCLMVDELASTIHARIKQQESDQ